MRKIQTVQRLVLNNDGSLPEELFCRGNYRYAGGKLVLEEGGEASFNTYFNSFFAAERKRLTDRKGSLSAEAVRDRPRSDPADGQQRK